MLAAGARRAWSRSRLGGDRAPWLVVIVMVRGARRWAGPWSPAVPTSLSVGVGRRRPAASSAQCPSRPSARRRQSKPPSRPGRAQPRSAPAPRRRRRRPGSAGGAASAAARRAICRSSLARASLRCRSLLEATRAPLPLPGRHRRSGVPARPRRHVRHATRPPECTGSDWESGVRGPASVYQVRMCRWGVRTVRRYPLAGRLGCGAGRRSRRKGERPCSSPAFPRTPSAPTATWSPPRRGSSAWWSTPASGCSTSSTRCSPSTGCSRPRCCSPTATSTTPSRSRRSAARAASPRTSTRTTGRCWPTRPRGCRSTSSQLFGGRLTYTEPEDVAELTDGADARRWPGWRSPSTTPRAIPAGRCCSGCPARGSRWEADRALPLRRRAVRRLDRPHRPARRQHAGDAGQPAGQDPPAGRRHRRAARPRPRDHHRPRAREQPVPRRAVVRRRRPAAPTRGL